MIGIILTAYGLTQTLVTTAFAANSADTPFTFKFMGGQPQITEFRAKADASDVYMFVESTNSQFTAHIVGSKDSLNHYLVLSADCSRGYTYSINQPGSVRMRNWVYDGEPRYSYAAIYAKPNYNLQFSAQVLWSPDSV